MNTSETHFLGVDVGGTHLKLGLVNKSGEILDFEKEETAPFKSHPSGFGVAFTEVIEKYLRKFPQVEKVGIGLPGMISKDRMVPLEIPAIPDLDNFKLKETLQLKFPDKQFFLENDAAAAAIGEFYFGKDNPPDDFLFITLGTGIGSAFVLDGNVFKGARGNAMEMGHVLSVDNARLETLIGRGGIIKIMERLIAADPGKAGRLKDEVLGMHLLVATAREGNEVSLKVFEEVGEILGQAIVSTIRILDVTNIYFGGGISAGLEFILPSLERTIHQHLTPYYRKDLKFKKATLENNAGTLGAAALCFMGSGL